MSRLDPLVAARARRHLEQQRRSRDRLAGAVAAYVARRRADGIYSTTVPAELADGTPVEVLVRLDIVRAP